MIGRRSERGGEKSYVGTMQKIPDEDGLDSSAKKPMRQHHAQTRDEGAVEGSFVSVAGPGGLG